MKATAKLLLAGAVVAGFTATAEAQSPIQRGDRAASPRSSTAPSTSSQGRLDHGGRSHGGGQWGGHRWRGHHWYPGWGFYFGAPLLYSGWYWGHPYAFDFYYPRSTVIYRESEAYPQSFPEGRIEGAPTTEIPRGEGAPSQGPLYMNYCESAKAYFPKVTRCPEGWRLATPTQ